jgi:hypothetical protein
MGWVARIARRLVGWYPGLAPRSLGYFGRNYPLVIRFPVYVYSGAIAACSAFPVLQPTYSPRRRCDLSTLGFRRFLTFTPQELTIRWLSQVRRLLPRIVFDQKGLKNILDGSIDMVSRYLL